MAIEKHINFFELQKASEKPGCPVCRIISDRAYKYIDNTFLSMLQTEDFAPFSARREDFVPFIQGTSFPFGTALP